MWTRGPCSSPSRMWQLCNMVLVLESWRKEWGYGMPLHSQRKLAGRYVSESPLHGDLARPLCTALKAKHRLSCRPQNIEDARVIWYLLREAANREWKQPIQPTKLNWVGDLKNKFVTDMEKHSWEFPLAGFQSTLSYNALFWDGNVHPMSLYVGNML